MPLVNIGRYEIFQVEKGSGFPIVLIHGLAGDHTAWTGPMESWSRDHRVVAFDNRGAGRSTQVDEPISTEDMADDTLALMDELGIERAHVIGRSMGGAIAQHMHLKAPDRVATLVLLASFAKLDPVGVRVLTNMREVLEWRGNWADHARHSVQNFLSPTFYNENPGTVAEIEKLIGGETRLPACYVRQNHACLEHDTLDRLGEITCPTLVMAGGRDPICSLTASGWMEDGFPDVESVIFDGCSHFFLVEEPERFMSAATDWLSRHAQPA